MPQRKQVSWTELRVGLLVIVGLVILALGIFFISGQIGFMTSRYELKTFFSSAGSLREGAQVRLAGIAVGNVDQIRLSPFTDPNKAVEINMKISKKFHDQIRSDSMASIETVGLLGESYVDITRGGPGKPPIPDKGTIQSQPTADMKQIAQNANDVISNLRVLSSKLNDITGQIQQGQGSIGKLIYDQALYNHLNTTVNSAQKLINKLNSGQGTLGALLNDKKLYNDAVTTVAKLNQVVDQVQKGKGTAGKLVNDPALYNNLNQVAKNANTLMANINQGQGTLGKLAKDPQLYDRLNDTMGHIDVVTKRIDAGQGTIGKLSTDPTLFNNLSASSVSLKEFLTEFRKNPKKYLTLHLHIF